ncbi:MAG: UTRA domain-containing protein [Pseudomonadota bacterium]
MAVLPKRDQIGYRKVKEIVMARIRSRHWPPDTILPGEADLAAELSCTRTTVNRAMQELAEDGIVERKRKAGTRVLPTPVRQARFTIPQVRTDIEGAGADYGYRLLSRDVAAAPGWLAARTGLAARSRMLHLTCLHLADGAPFQLEDRWVDVAAVPAILDADFDTSGPGEWLVREVPYTDIDVAFFAASLSAAQAARLGAAPGDASFVAERMTWLEGDLVTFVTLNFRPGHRMQATG